MYNARLNVFIVLLGQYSFILEASKCLCRWLLGELILQSILQLYSTFVKGTQQHANRVQAASASRGASGSSVCSTTWGVNGSSVGLQLSPMLRCVHDHQWSTILLLPILSPFFIIFHLSRCHRSHIWGLKSHATAAASTDCGVQCFGLCQGGAAKGLGGWNILGYSMSLDQKDTRNITEITE